MSEGKRCPACSRLLDPLRAPVVRIVAGKVTAFCSNECARGDARPPDGPDAEAGPSEAPAPLLLGRSGAAAGPQAITDRPSGAQASPKAIEPGRERSAPIALAEGRAHSPRSKKRVVLAALGTLVAAGIGGAVVQMVSPGRSGPAQALAPSASPAATPERAEEASRGASQDAVGVPDDATLLALATQTLEDYLRDGSPRVRRVAARALARAGSEAAINELVKQYDAETGAIARLDLAYALALAEHPKGKEVLAEALSADRRDTRFSAARYLAMLGDDRGRAQLKSALSLTTHRLSAAEAMSWLGDGEAIKVLKEALASKDVEPRMRAAEALAHVGDPAGAELLRTLIEDEHYALGAAEALAWLGDPAALPLLTRALSHSRICVDAALALRRMGHKADLASLATSLTSADEVGRVAAAEAVIVLLGPKVPVELEARKVKPLVAGAVLIKAPAKAAASGAAPGPEKSGAPAGAGAAAPAGAAPAAAAPAGAAEPSPPDGTAGAAAPTAADGAKVSPNAEGQPGGAAKMAPEPTEAHNR